MEYQEEDLQRLQKIRKKLIKAETTALTLTYGDFVSDKSRRETILRNLHQVSEESLLLSASIQQQIKGIGVLKSFRNALYQYQIEADSHVMWKKINRLIPEIMNDIRELVHKLEGKKAA